MLLGNDTELSLSVLDEIYLLVYLCSVVYPSAPKSELVGEFNPGIEYLILPTLTTGLRK